MKLYTINEIVDMSGNMMLLFGDSGVGKSVSIMQTAEMPILYLMAEPRSVKKMLAAANRPDIKIKFGFYEGWEDIMEFVTNQSNFEGAKTIVLDSLTHLMSIGLSDELTEESYNASDKKGGKDLVMRVKLSLESYGALSGQMLRLTNALSKLSQIGYTVICIARSEQSPKFDRSLTAAPALKGREYVKYLAGFMDQIGYVSQRIDEDGKILYPPYVSFESDGSVMAKWSGVQLPGGVSRKILNIEKIVKAARGEKVNGNPIKPIIEDEVA